MKPVLLAVAVACLAGCATPAVVPAPALRALLPLERFGLEGRLQVRDGERSAAVGVDWQHGPARDEWLFTGPLGQGLARIEADATGAHMLLADGRRSEAASAGELAEALLGVSAPFEALPRWVTARPAATAQVRQLDALGRPLQLVDQGWTIDYLEYAGEAPDSPPRKIDLQRGDTRLRLIVDSWNP